MYASTPDLLRLLFVPALAWAAWRDVETRRVPNVVWYPFAALGVALMGWEMLVRLPVGGPGTRRFLLRTAISLGFVVPLSYAFWRMGGFGGADAKAFMTVALLFPTVPLYQLFGVVFPLQPTALGVFSMTVLTNSVVVALAYPLSLAARNALDGEFAAVMFLGRRVPVSSLSTTHGRLFETLEGRTRRGLDLDALRMYLRWRGTTLRAVRTAPERHRPSSSVGATHDPGDGAVGDGPRTDGGRDGSAVDAGPADDPWGAERFLAELDGTAYGTTPETLREGLELVSARDDVWVSPGVPFLVPTFVGLLVALVYGDLVVAAMSAVVAA